MRLMQQNVNNLTQLQSKMEDMVSSYDNFMKELNQLSVSKSE